MIDYACTSTENELQKCHGYLLPMQVSCLAISPSEYGSIISIEPDIEQDCFL